MKRTEVESKGGSFPCSSECGTSINTVAALDIERRKGLNGLTDLRKTQIRQVAPLKSFEPLNKLIV
jgi:hypothetical protein